MARQATTERTSGRPRSFDVDEVLDRTIEVFRSRGYEASSMAELERATGLNVSSLYNTFGSKEGLFHQALARYQTQRLGFFSAALGNGTEGLTDLHRTLDLQEQESASAWALQGCLAINVMAELGPRAGDAKQQLIDFRVGLANAVRLPLERAAAMGEISPDQVPNAVAMLVCFTLGVGVLMRSEAPTAELAQHFAAAHAVVESWRIRPASR